MILTKSATYTGGEWTYVGIIGHLGKGPGVGGQIDRIHWLIVYCKCSPLRQRPAGTLDGEYSSNYVHFVALKVIWKF